MGACERGCHSNCRALEGVSVDVRSVVVVSDPVVLTDVGVIVVGVVVGISVLTEDGVMVVDVCMV